MKTTRIANGPATFPQGWKLVSLLSLLTATGAFAAPDLARVPAPRPRITDEVRHRVANESRPTSAPEEALPAKEGVVMLAPVRVTDTYRPALGSREAAGPADRPFTWTEGGSVLKHEGRRFTTELKCQYNPEHKGIDFLSISW